MEFCNRGNLENKVKSKGNLEENEAVSVLKQIINGLSVSIIVNIGIT